MNIFNIHTNIISDYKSYIKSFLSIKDARIKEVVEKAFEESGFMPEPLIQFNPSFDKGQTLKELVGRVKFMKSCLPSLGLTIYTNIRSKL